MTEDSSCAQVFLPSANDHASHLVSTYADLRSERQSLSACSRHLLRRYDAADRQWFAFDQSMATAKGARKAAPAQDSEGDGFSPTDSKEFVTTSVPCAAGSTSWRCGASNSNLRSVNYSAPAIQRVKATAIREIGKHPSTPATVARKNSAYLCSALPAVFVGWRGTHCTACREPGARARAATVALPARRTRPGAGRRRRGRVADFGRHPRGPSRHRAGADGAGWTLPHMDAFLRAGRSWFSSSFGIDLYGRSTAWELPRGRARGQAMGPPPISRATAACCTGAGGRRGY